MMISLAIILLPNFKNTGGRDNADVAVFQVRQGKLPGSMEYCHAVEFLLLPVS